MAETRTAPEALKPGAQLGSSSFMQLPHVSAFDELDIAIVGVPWDGGTASPVGSRHAPRTIRVMSNRLRRLHPLLETSPFDMCAVGDVGDVKIDPFDQAKSLTAIEAFYSELASHGVHPITAGGDHLVTLPILRAVARHAPVGVVHFDAHSDTAEAGSDGSRYTAATPFRRAVEEGLVDPKRVVQIGLRGTVRSNERNRWARDVGMRQVTMDDLYKLGLDGVIRAAREIIGDAPAYVSFDIDGIDPAFAPGTGTPVIGGLTTYESQRILQGLRGLDLVGGDVVEVSPQYDLNDLTSLVGASLMFEILCLVVDAQDRRRKTKRSA
jgi:guanidinopropionase